MAHLYTSPADKLARKILKAASKEPAQKLTLPIIEGWLLGELPEAIGGAIAFVVEQGWLRYEGGGLVTPAGEELGKRSRAGVKGRSRVLAWDGPGQGIARARRPPSGS